MGPRIGPVAPHRYFTTIKIKPSCLTVLMPFKSILAEKISHLGLVIAVGTSVLFLSLVNPADVNSQIVFVRERFSTFLTR